jgi:Acetyltransferases
MSPVIEKCLINHLDLLQMISAETYKETFAGITSVETMNIYLQEAFNNNKLTEELNNSGSEFYFLYSENNIAGYLKINCAPAQTDINAPDSLEIERIYVRKKYKRMGLGKTLVNFALKRAFEMNKNYVWLGVWEKNINAIAFYNKMGFVKNGTHIFKMGNEEQSDFIFKKILTQ